MYLKAILFAFNGVSFFSHIVHPTFEINLDLTSGFLSAIESFAHEVYKGSVQSIDFGPHSIMTLKVPLTKEDITPSAHFNIIAFVDKSTAQKNIMQDLESIRDSFLKIYTSLDVMNWDGNILTFFSFKKIINNVLKIDAQGVAITITPEQSNARSQPITTEIKEAFSFNLFTNNKKILHSYNIGIDSTKSNAIMDNVMENLANVNQTVWEGIIPLLEDHLIVGAIAKECSPGKHYSNLDPKEKVYFSICYFLNDQFQIYIAPIISELKSQFAIICDTIIHKEGSDLALMFEQLKTHADIITRTGSPLIKVQKNTKIDISTFDICNLKNCDQLIYGLFTGKPVVIINNNLDKAKLYINQILSFTPHRSLRIAELPEKSLAGSEFDIAIISQKEAKHYKEHIQLDMEKYQIKNGEPNKFCEKIQKDLATISDPQLAIQYLRRKVNWLLSKATLIRNLSWELKINPKEMNAIRADMDPDTEKLVLALSEGNNSLLQNLVDFLISQIPMKTLKLDENFITFNDHKILVNTKIPTEKSKEYYEKLMKLGNMMLGPRYMVLFQQS